MTMGLTGGVSKLFLNAFNSVETVGLDNFLKLVESRNDPYERQRGLITGTHARTHARTASHLVLISYVFVQSAITSQCK